MPSILLVTAAYPPSRQIGGRRVYRFAKGLRDLGWSVTVLCPKPRYMAPLDPAGAAERGIEVVHTEVLAPRVWFRSQAAATPAPAGPQPSTRRPVLQLAKQMATQVLQVTEFPDEFSGWLPPAVVAMAGRKFDVVLASAPPQTSLLVGAQLARHMGAPLVLDYRDPWLEVMSEDGSYGQERAYPPWLRRLHRWAEDRVLAQARLVLGVTPQICRWLQPRTRTNVAFLPNSLDGAPPNPPLARDLPLRLVYAGSLAYDRNLDSVLGSLAMLRATWGPDRLQLTYAGQHGDRLRHSAEQHGVADYIDDRGMVGHAVSQALYRGAAAGIVSVSARTDYSYPGKLFEVLAAGCPILLVGPTHCEAAQLVRDLHAGVVDSGEDLQASAAALAGLLQRDPEPLAGIDQWLAPVHVAALDDHLRRAVDSPRYP